MQHIAILNKSRKLLQLITSGEKTIESRWLVHKSAPWDKVKIGETIYFKESGEPVTVKTVAGDVKYFHLPNESLKKLYDEYGTKIGFTSLEQLKKYASGKKYCVLVFLKNVEEIKPFDIDKSGFGIMSAWICIDDVKKLKL